MKTSRGNNNSNDFASQAHGQHNPQKLSPNPVASLNYGSFDFDIDREFIEENKKIDPNLVKHRQKSRQKLHPSQNHKGEREEPKFTNFTLNREFQQQGLPSL